MESSKAFIATQNPLEFYNGQALINVTMEFKYIDDNDEEQDFGFEDYVSAYLRIFDDRQEQMVKNFSSQINRSGNILIFNCSISDMTFADLGNYFYEVGYNRSGYEIALSYGRVTII